MAAEDYIDFSHVHSDDVEFVSGNAGYTSVRYSEKMFPPQRTKPSKNKDTLWVTAVGESIRIADMTDNHLGNTIRYIARQLEEHRSASEVMNARGYPVPEYIIRNKTGSEWLDILGKEAMRRETKAIAAAKKVLGQ